MKRICLLFWLTIATIIVSCKEDNKSEKLTTELGKKKHLLSKLTFSSSPRKPTVFTYDSLGRIIRIEAPNYSLNYTYSDGGLLTKVVEEFGEFIITTDLRYKNDKIKSALVTTFNKLFYTREKQHVSYTLNAKNQIKKISYAENPGRNLTFTYDSKGNLIKEESSLKVSEYTYSDKKGPYADCFIKSRYTDFDIVLFTPYLITSSIIKLKSGQTLSYEIRPTFNEAQYPVLAETKAIDAGHLQNNTATYEYLIK
jgi:YD repeat-containing protein